MQQLLASLRTANAHLTTFLHWLITALHRQRRAQLIAVIIVSVLIASFATALTRSAHNERNRWVSHVRVRVTTQAVSQGEAFTNANTALRDIPKALIADDAITTLPSGASARVSLQARTALTTSLLTLNNTSLAIPQGWRGVAMPVDLVAPNLSAGDRVDVITGDQIVVEGALVVAAPVRNVGASQTMGPNGITIAVQAAQSGVVASAVRRGDISLVLVNN